MLEIVELWLLGWVKVWVSGLWCCVWRRPNNGCLGYCMICQSLWFVICSGLGCYSVIGWAQGLYKRHCKNMATKWLGLILWKFACFVMRTTSIAFLHYFLIVSKEWTWNLKIVYDYMICIFSALCYDLLHMKILWHDILFMLSSRLYHGCKIVAFVIMLVPISLLMSTSTLEIKWFFVTRVSYVHTWDFENDEGEIIFYFCIAWLLGRA